MHVVNDWNRTKRELKENISHVSGLQSQTEKKSWSGNLKDFTPCWFRDTCCYCLWSHSTGHSQRSMLSWRSQTVTGLLFLWATWFYAAHVSSLWTAGHSEQSVATLRSCSSSSNSWLWLLRPALSFKLTGCQKNKEHESSLCFYKCIFGIAVRSYLVLFCCCSLRATEQNVVEFRDVLYLNLDHYFHLYPADDVCSSWH